jgi:hypothetical protein
VHLRRALLLFALVLGLSAVAASIAPAPRVAEEEPAPAPPPPSAAESAAAEVTTVSFGLPHDARKPPRREVKAGTPLVVMVRAAEPGEVSIPRLGQVTNVAAGVSARFDVLAPEPGRYDVIFQPVDAEPTLLGSIVSRR